jgi:hypothetical protein
LTDDDDQVVLIQSECGFLLSYLAAEFISPVSTTLIYRIGHQ